MCIMCHQHIILQYLTETVYKVSSLATLDTYVINIERLRLGQKIQRFIYCMQSTLTSTAWLGPLQHVNIYCPSSTQK